MNIDEKKRAIQLRDRSVRVISQNGKFRAVCVKNTTSAQTAQKNHNLKGVAAVLLAKALAGATMAASFLKGEERIVLEADGNGFISKVFAEAMQLGEIRGFVDFKNNNRDFQFDKFEEILGVGLLRISRILYNQIEPIQGIVPLEKGDITTDLAYYYNQSEQIPSSVIIDCSIDDEGNILQSGGMIIQAMPGYSQDELMKIFDKLNSSKPLYEYFADGLNPKEVLSEVLPFEFEVINSSQVDFFCRCSKDNFTSKLLTLGLKEIIEMQKINHNELVCRYCNKHYYLTETDFISLREQLLAKNN
jgi:molecular chaperone Hsp33